MITVYFVCYSYNAIFFILMTYHLICNKSNTTGETNGTCTVSLPEHLSSPPVYVARSVFFVQYFVGQCLFFFLFPLVTVLSRFRDPDYPFGIFKLFSLVNKDYDRIIDISFNSIVSVTTFCVGVYCRVCKKCSWFCNYLLLGFILHRFQEMAIVFVIK